MIKILVTDGLAEKGVDILRQIKEFQVDVKPKPDPEELKQIIGEYNGLIIRSATKVTKELIQQAQNLKVIGRAGVGLDNVDIPAATRKGIVVMNTPGGNTISTAEHTLSMILALSRNIPQANRSLKNKEWDRKRFMGTEIYGKVLGIIGLGRIGAEVARRAAAFGMKIVAHDPYLSLEKARELEIESVELNRLCEVSDYITIHAPLTEETRHMISDNEFKIMKTGVRIINCARGGIIDEEALLRAIESGKVAGCALDVYEKEPPFESPLLDMDCVICTPHLGASTEEAQINVAVEIAQQVADALLGRGVRNAVNMPSATPEVLEEIQPYLRLAEKMGALECQLLSGRISQVKIEYSGDITRYPLQPITIALLKGLFSPILGTEVNYVNASLLAKERGVKVIETRSSELENYASLISVEVATDKDKSQVAGTLFTRRDLRIVKIGPFHVDAIPEGYMLIVTNKDRPGIIGQIGSLLGDNNINIAEMTFGRVEKGGDAITVLNVDSQVSNEVLEKIKQSENILDVKQIKL